MVQYSQVLKFSIILNKMSNLCSRLSRVASMMDYFGVKKMMDNKITHIQIN